jgi:hypothetical protein
MQFIPCVNHFFLELVDLTQDLTTHFVRIEHISRYTASYISQNSARSKHLWRNTNPSLDSVSDNQRTSYSCLLGSCGISYRPQAYTNQLSRIFPRGISRNAFKHQTPQSLPLWLVRCLSTRSVRSLAIASTKKDQDSHKAPRQMH